MNIYTAFSSRGMGPPYDKRTYKSYNTIALVLRPEINHNSVLRVYVTFNVGSARHGFLQFSFARHYIRGKKKKKQYIA